MQTFNRMLQKSLLMSKPSGTHHLSASVLLLTPQQATRLVNEDIYTTMRLGPLDDETILSCFNAATRLSAGKFSWVYAIRDWIRERQTIVGYGHVSSTDFSMIQLEHMLKKAGEVQKRPE